MAIPLEPSAWENPAQQNNLPYELQAAARHIAAQRAAAEEESVGEAEQNEQALAQNQAESAAVDDVNELGPSRTQNADLRDQATSYAAQQAADLSLNEGSRWIAKIAGHGGNALDTADAGVVDLGLAWSMTFMYDTARAVTTVMVPEERNSDDAVQTEVVKKTAEIVFPRYRPMREPGDFLYYIFEFLVFGVVMVFTLGLVVIVTYALYKLGSFGLQFLEAVYGAIS